MALLILALLQRIFLMSSLMLLLVWLIFFMVLIKLLPILGTISGKTVKVMVLSYYPAECHADYFDFERIEALKPAIEACGISTLSQSPMLGFHKQMDNR